ncbi:hypothetical protein ACFX11_003518 [Malus domestica]
MVVHAMGFTYHLHRLILSRSPYFRNMLHGPCKEAILHRCLYPIASSPFPLSPPNRNCNACLHCSRFRSWSSSSSLLTDLLLESRKKIYPKPHRSEHEKGSTDQVNIREK